MSKQEIYELAKEINERLKIANHYINEWEIIMLQGNSDNGRLFNKYYFSLAFIRKAYLEMTIITLSTIFERNGDVNLYKLRKSIENFLGKSIEKADEKYGEDFIRIVEGLKHIRDKGIAHTDARNISQYWEQASISKGDISKIIQDTHKYILYLLDLIDIKNPSDICLSDFSESGLKLIYSKLKDNNEEEFNAGVANIQRNIDFLLNR